MNTILQHVTLGIIADGRTSISVMAPAALACILFVQEAVSNQSMHILLDADRLCEQQFAVLIGQLQAPEDVRPPTRPTPQPQAQPTPSPAVTATPSTPAYTAEAEESDSQTAPLLPITNPAATPPATPASPPTTTVTPPPSQPSMGRLLWDHFRSDPSARLCETCNIRIAVSFLMQHP